MNASKICGVFFPRFSFFFIALQMTNLVYLLFVERAASLLKAQ